uniref:Uncharacterized protein n=1 Tax=Nelumbo nucifera TaxID=4432 RepID=A0A822ZCR5_NELNU|nr:TPA_asm: hypothetical protein HUJ06_015794 [Nelumbo nucifera]
MVNQLQMCDASSIKDARERKGQDLLHLHVFSGGFQGGKDQNITGQQSAWQKPPFLKEILLKSNLVVQQLILLNVFAHQENCVAILPPKNKCNIHD